MTGNLVAHFHIKDPSRKTLSYLSERGINIDTPAMKFTDSEFHLEFELSIEIVDGSIDQGSREINSDMVFAINMTKAAIKTYSGSARWYCFDHLDTLNRFVESLYHSFNCSVSQVEYDMEDLAMCLSSNKEIFRTIHEKESLEKPCENIMTLMAFRRYIKGENDYPNLIDFCDLVEQSLREDTVIIYSSVIPYNDSTIDVSFFYTTELKV